MSNQSASLLILFFFILVQFQIFYLKSKTKLIFGLKNFVFKINNILL